MRRNLDIISGFLLYAFEADRNQKLSPDGTQVVTFCEHRLRYGLLLRND